MRKKIIGVSIVACCLAAVAVSEAAVNQEGAVRVTVLGQLKPYRLPRVAPAPISVFLSGHVSSADKAIPPQVTTLAIKLNKHGKLDPGKITGCRKPQIQTATTERALAACGSAVVGSGRFWANVVLAGQDPYPTRGRLLIFNGVENGRSVLFAHIYTTKPFTTSFVITFAIRKITEGPYGTELNASLPGALGTWGYVDRIKLTLKRFYRDHGEQRSYFNASCPAPKGTKTVAFKLARMRFKFAGGQELSSNLTRSCAVKE